MFVSGLVQDAHTGKPLPGVRVSSREGDAMGFSDCAGRFLLQVPCCPQALQLEHRLYGARSVPLGRHSGSLVVALELAALPEEPVTA